MENSTQMQYHSEMKEYELMFNDDDVVTRANAYITAKSSSTLIENKIFALATKKADYDNTGKLSVKITASELRGLLHVSGNGFYDTLKKAAVSMRGRALYLENKYKQEFAYINLLTSAIFKNGVFTINFNPEVNFLISDLKRDYTSMRLSTLFQFRSVYSFRLYEILKVHAFKINKHNDPIIVEYGLSELKITLNMIEIEDKEIKLELQKKSPDYDKIVHEMVGQEPFADWYRFKINVLEKAIHEINETTELFVQYKTIRKGRGGKVVKIIFYVSLHEMVDAEATEISTPKKKVKRKELIAEVREMIKEIELTDKDITALLKAADNNVNKIEKYYYLSLQQGYIKNWMGWMIGAIRDDYEEPVPMLEGSVEKAKKIKKVQEEYERDKEQVAKTVWDKTKKEPLFDEFLDYINMNIELFEMNRTPKECYTEYVQWKISQL